MSLQLVRPVTVKVIVTETLKEKLLLELRSALQKLEAEIKQVEVTGKRLVQDLEKKQPERLDAVREQIEKELHKRQETRRELQERIKAVAALVLGDEQVHSTVDHIVSIDVGDDWSKANSREIVLKDDRVVEIR